MIDLAKLARLPPKTRLRKILRILQEAELGLARGQEPNAEYWLAVAGLLAEEPRLEPSARQAAEALRNVLSGPMGLEPAVRRALNRARHALLASLHAEPAEWDLLAADGRLDAAARTVLPVVVYLEEVRSPFNAVSYTHLTLPTIYSV